MHGKQDSGQSDPGRQSEGVYRCVMPSWARSGLPAYTPENKRQGWLQKLGNALCKSADFLFWACVVFSAAVILFSVTACLTSWLVPLLLA